MNTYAYIGNRATMRNEEIAGCAKNRQRPETHKRDSRKDSAKRSEGLAENPVAFTGFIHKESNMSASRKPLSAERLVEVSDAVLRATMSALDGSNRHASQSTFDIRAEDESPLNDVDSPGSRDVPANTARPQGDASIRPLDGPAKGKREAVRPIVVHGCTAFEIEEACRFLVRLGVLEAPPARHAA